MKNHGVLSATVLLALQVLRSGAAVLYVDASSSSPVPPYTDWSTAAATIQDAIDASTNGDLVLVASGSYSVGSNTLSRVGLYKPITVQSADGPATTSIHGRTSNPAMRCAYVGSGAFLVGFTLTGGHSTSDGGGVWCDSGAVISNCVVTGNSSTQNGGGIAGGGTVFNCTITGNSGRWGGGTSGNTLCGCTISGNTASQNGGGANGGTLNNCIVSGNVANLGGAAIGSAMNNCTIVGNSVSVGSMWTVGGPVSSTLSNCIVYYNSVYNWAYGGGPLENWNYCCTTPSFAGTGVFDRAPLFVDQSGGDLHLQTNSPCINAGDNSSVAASTDLDGNARIVGGYVDLGAYEFQSALPPSPFVQANYTNLLTGFAASFNAGLNWGLAVSAYWDFGDGTVASNSLALTHAWQTTGDFPVIVQVFAPNISAGFSATVTVHVASQIIYYVDPAGTNPVPPYSSWQTAATNIQDAVDVATPAPGSLVLATNGIFQFGGRAVFGAMTNRLAVTKPITVQSVNGPAVTIIQGAQASGSIYGGSAMRCVYLTNNASLIGFTLTNGATRLSGDNSQEQSGGGAWCASTNVVLSDCVFIGNAARWTGGGVYGGTLNNCTVSGNRAEYRAGGGAESCTLNNCVLKGNSSGADGGGADQCSLNNCVVTMNSASVNGGGAVSSRLKGCTLAGNVAQIAGGGSWGGALTNCIVYYNDSPGGSNYSGGTLSYCCAAPLPGGTGNITTEPQLTDAVHIGPSSPCRGAGSAANITGTDIDGEPWLNPPSIGCDEYYATPVSGPLSVAIQVAYTNVAAGFAQTFQGVISGRASLSFWDFGDGILLTNRPNVSRSWSAAGTYQVVLTAYNDSFPAGASATSMVHVASGPIHYVSQDSLNPVAPYFSWDKAATSIQDAIDAAFGGSTVLVSNGVYQTGGRVMFGLLTNRVAVNKQVTVQSVNGAAATVIQGNPGLGSNAVRCVYLTNHAVLNGFTLAGGATAATGDPVKEESGGGAWCESTNCLLLNCLIVSNSAFLNGGGECFGTLSNCTLVGNTATNSSSGSGGGAYFGQLFSCVLSNNAAAGAGGGAYSNTLISCTIWSNRVNGSPSAFGGGANGCTLDNCSLVGNQAKGFDAYGGGAFRCSLSNCSLAANFAQEGGGAFASTLNACSVRSNWATLSGGGIYSGVVNNSSLIGNASTNSGGGAYSSTLNDCLLFANYSRASGGAAYLGTLSGCTITANSAGAGSASSQGGVAYTAVKNSILYFNSGLSSVSSPLTNCCTTPMPTGTYDGGGNFTNDPLFVNLTNDFRLQSASPCINAGRNAYVTNSTDLDGKPRIVGATVDIGAYEFQPLGRDAFNAWLQQYGLPTDGSATYADPDHDGMNNLQEWIAGTVPTDAASALRILSATPNSFGVDLVWQSVSNRAYFVERSTDLTAHPPFLTLATGVPGQSGTTTFKDATAVGPGPFFYRVGVQADSNHLYTPFSVLSYAWLQQYGLPTDGTADFVDSDGDGMNNWQEWIAGTNPTNAASVLRLAAPVITYGAAGIRLTWQSVSNRTYYLQRSANLAAQPAFSTIRSNITGHGGLTTVADTNSPGTGTYFYRVGIQ